MDECRGDNNTTTKILRYEESPSRYSHALVSSREDREPGSEERSHQDDKDGGDPHTYPAVEVSIQPSASASSGQVIADVERVASQTLGEDFTTEWTDIGYQEKQAGGYAPLIFALGVVMIFLLLAGQYESLSLPFVVLLVTPLAVLGAVGALALRGMALDIFGQVGLLLLVGLAAKNAILIVTFAQDTRRNGADALDAAQEAARLRLRPILMTSFAFILGALPLAIANGAGANARISIGTVVIGGLVVASLMTLVFTPLFYIAASRLTRKNRTAQSPSQLQA